MSIKMKILVTTIPFFLVFGLITMFMSVSTLEKQSEQSLSTIENVMTADKNEKLNDLVRNTFEIMASQYRAAHDIDQVAKSYEQELQSVVNIAYTSIDGIYNNSMISDFEKKERALEVIKSMRYAGDNYLWINDMTAAMVMHPIKPALDGQDLSDFKDPNGKKLFSEMVEVCKTDKQGFVSYMWPKPGEEKPIPKLSFVRLFEPWGWVIGTGVYLELAEKRFQEEARKQIGNLRFGPDNKDYFFIIDTDAHMVMHPIKPELDGKAMGDFEDPAGKKLFAEMVSVSKEKGEGFVSYMWPKPDEEKPVAKQSFVKLFKDWGWIVGTGIYIDDIEKAMQEQKTSFASAIGKQRLWLIIVSVVMIVIVSALMLFVAMRISSPIKRAAEMLKDIAEGEGDLTQRLVANTKDELADMARWFNVFVEKLQKMVSNISADSVRIADSVASLTGISTEMSSNAGNVSDRSESVAAAVEEMSANMGTVAASMEQTASNVDMVAAAVEEMTTTINEIAETSEKARSITEQAVSQASTASSQVDDLGTAAQEISKVLETISDISDQVDLLALNATIEAARAGDAGKGFAVVASEIKELAKQTAEAADQIRGRIEGIQKTTSATVIEIENISRVVGENSDIVNAIATAVEEQSVTANEISQNVTQISSGIQEININVAESSQVSSEIAKDISDVNNVSSAMSNNAGDVSENAEKLRELSESLSRLVSSFKV